MNSTLLRFAQRWLVTTVAVLVAANVVGGIHHTGFPALVVASLLLGLVNAFVRPVLVAVGISFIVATLGLGLVVINALLFWAVGSLGLGFRVDGFWPAFKGAIVISLVSFVANLLLGAGPRVAVRKAPRRDGPGPGDTGSGPVIDV